MISEYSIKEVDNGQSLVLRLVLFAPPKIYACKNHMFNSLSFSRCDAYMDHLCLQLLLLWEPYPAAFGHEVG